MFAQNLDSLYNKLLRINEVKTSKYPVIQSLGGTEKCGFGLANIIKRNLNLYSSEQQNNINNILSRPELQTSIVSPKGIFRIHYDTTGANTPTYDINALAIAFDSSYIFEVELLGFPPHPSDNGSGGDDLYDVYVRNLNGSLYGQTTQDASVGSSTTSSFIEIDNSFSQNEGYNTFGINAARVTAAHEYHHAIQLGNYGYFSEDVYFHELTSTAFEEFVFDEVNDYYYYINSYFRNTDRRLENNSGYNLAVLGIYLKERFFNEDPMRGYNILKSTWENMVNNRAVVALASAFNNYNTSFEIEFNNFGKWIFFTGKNTHPGEYFEEAQFYPDVSSTYEFELTNKQFTFSFSSEPTGLNYVRLFNYYDGLADTIDAVVSNSDVFGSISSGNETTVQYTLSEEVFANSEPINTDYYKLLDSFGSQFIQDSYIINGEPADENFARSTVDFAYPQPFTYTNSGLISFPCYPDLSNEAELKVFSSDMNLVFSDRVPINTAGNIVAKWNGLDKSGDRLANGVYIFVTKANNKIKKGKFIILY